MNALERQQESTAKVYQDPQALWLACSTHLRKVNVVQLARYGANFFECNKHCWKLRIRRARGDYNNGEDVDILHPKAYNELKLS